MQLKSLCCFGIKDSLLSVLLQACTAWKTHAVETQILVIVQRLSVTGTRPLFLLTVLPPQTFLVSPLSLSLSSIHPPRHHLCGYTVFSCRTWENSPPSPRSCGDRGALTVTVAVPLLFTPLVQLLMTATKGGCRFILRDRLLFFLFIYLLWRRLQWISSMSIDRCQDNHLSHSRFISHCI